VLFGYALNIQKCIGCRRCVKACVQENNQSRCDESHKGNLTLYTLFSVLFLH
jgi:Fe-S-cluster-containing dehydrogenase component